MNDRLQSLVELLMGVVATYGMNVLGAILTLIAGFVAAGWLSRLTHRTMRRSDRIDPVFKPLPGKIVRIAVMVFTVIAVLNRFGVQTTSLIALLGAAGLAIGLALQGTLIKVDALGESSVNILFRVWTARADWWDTKRDLVQRCKDALDAGGISIPFPQRDVRLIAQAQADKPAGL